MNEDEILEKDDFIIKCELSNEEILKRVEGYVYKQVEDNIKQTKQMFTNMTLESEEPYIDKIIEMYRLSDKEIIDTMLEEIENQKHSLVINNTSVDKDDPEVIKRTLNHYILNIQHRAYTRCCDKIYDNHFKNKFLMRITLRTFFAKSAIATFKQTLESTRNILISLKKAKVKEAQPLRRKINTVLNNFDKRLESMILSAENYITEELIDKCVGLTDNSQNGYYPDLSEYMNSIETKVLKVIWNDVMSQEETNLMDEVNWLIGSNEYKITK